ncbi:type II toxin-antitoxin system RelE/ParE family toxin [Flavivirga rizhaonensis]|uniref:Type II toxin-antitoxin system RelE/ParE family toxin n=1 Tax=Flavivirga rizhaonensis TaxID=2559571 RepID=A0A4S1DSS9_9FLAO|nr:type II toxin-antitoxin system RelE/ParE family toxin [Flavivirga rizhaonensis]TGV01080.1 type II toxin-antitoxin system RelE/ParE family toxin [Flavivirga rizhaonensis]
MGKKIVWSPTSLRQLEEVHTDIFEVSKSLNIADRVIGDILSSADVLSSQPEIYTLDENKLNNDGSYRSYEVRTYNIAYRILTDTIRIIRVRYSGKEPRGY